MAYFWTQDDDLDFVFSLSRSLDGDDDSNIEFMIVDQIWKPVAKFNCSIDRRHLIADVPEELQKFTDDSQRITVIHRCPDNEFNDMLAILQQIFRGKSGLAINID